METSNHLLLHCSYYFEVWDYFIKAFHISWHIPETVLQLFNAWDTNVLAGRCKRVWDIMHYAIIWNLWRERNHRVFGSSGPKGVAELKFLIKQSVVLWSCDLDTFKFITTDQILHHWEMIIHV